MLIPTEIRVTSTKQTATNVTPVARRALTGEEVKTRLRERDGLTLKAWAKKRGYPYHLVSNVVRGVNRATFGTGYRIAVELGMK